MKSKVFFLVALLCSAFVFTSCDSDDNDKYMPENAVITAFNLKYPDAQRTSWESKGGYEKAEFYIGSYETEAWFDRIGNWVMTETDIPYSDLPQAVKTCFEASQYVNWEVDDVDKIERFDAATIYIIEVEKGETDIDLYYAEDGTFIKETTDVDDEHIPSIIPDALKKAVLELYPGATILEIDTEINGIEVDILHENIHKEVWFDTNNLWVHTKWDIMESQVPEIIMSAFHASAYASYHIDDIDVIEKADGLFYEFELEQGEQEVKVVFRQDGTMVQSA